MLITSSVARLFHAHVNEQSGECDQLAVAVLQLHAPEPRPDARQLLQFAWLRNDQLVQHELKLTGSVAWAIIFCSRKASANTSSF